MTAPNGESFDSVRDVSTHGREESGTKNHPV
jgi:hypothetical protein